MALVQELAQDADDQPKTFVPVSQPLIGRQEQLRALGEILRRPGTIAQLVGRAGSGKSHCAKTFARIWSDQQDSKRWAFWLNAETETVLRQSYLRLLTSLGSVVPAGDVSTTEVAHLVWDKLKVSQFDYLLVFDNARELFRNTTGDENTATFPFIPTGRDDWGLGRILFTSRPESLEDSDCSAVDIEKVVLEALDPNEAVRLLFADDREASRATAETLVKRLDFLPLAIISVSGLIHDKNQRIEEFGTGNGVEDALKGALEYAHAQPGLASILEIAAFISSNAIPMALLGGNSDNVSRLCGMNLLLKAEDDSYSIHRVHQDILRSIYSSGAAIDAMERVLRGFDRRKSLTYTLGKSLIAHVEAMATHIEAAKIKEQEGKKLAKIFRANGQVLQFAEMRYLTAAQYFQKALKIIRDVDGADANNLDVAATLESLGVVHTQRGEFKIAQESLESALVMKRKVYDDDAKNKDLAETLHNLGNVYYERGDLERAEAQYRESLVMKQQEYSRDSKNLDLAATLQNLGNISIQRANTDDAVVKYEEALEMQRHVFGADAKNMDIAGTLQNLGAAYKQCGTLDVAAAKYEEALVIKRHLYGKDARNTDMAAALHNLGIVYRQLGNLAGAEMKYNEALVIQRHVYGDNAINVALAATLENLGNVYYQSSNLDKAEEKYEEAFAMHQHICGEEEENAPMVRIFRRLSFTRIEDEKVLKNLTLIGSIKHGDYLAISEGVMYIAAAGIFQGVRRFFSGGSIDVDEVLDLLEGVVNHAVRRFHSPLQAVHEEFRNGCATALGGLRRYADWFTKEEKWDLADRLDAFIEDFEQRLQAITEKTLPPAAGIGRVDLSDGH